MTKFDYFSCKSIFNLLQYRVVKCYPILKGHHKALPLNDFASASLTSTSPNLAPGID